MSTTTKVVIGAVVLFVVAPIVLFGVGVSAINNRPSQPPLPGGFPIDPKTGKPFTLNGHYV